MRPRDTCLVSASVQTHLQDSLEQVRVVYGGQGSLYIAIYSEPKKRVVSLGFKRTVFIYIILYEYGTFKIAICLAFLGIPIYRSSFFALH